MAKDTSAACSLEANDLKQRLAEIAEVGAAGLISRDRDGLRHLLRFRADADTRRRLKEIVVAEAKCCSFLDLALSEKDGELILVVAAPQDAQGLADGLADVFGSGRRK
jgi:hypothetical protein